METLSLRMDIENLDCFSKVLKEKRSAVLRELVKEGRKHKAVELYKTRKVSLGLGARLAGVTLSEFIDILREHNAVLNLEREDVKQALKNARKMI
ncbi:MAG TPA: UPF0175 family protein [Candidatus Nanoarchaeia archaeon]|nr:UPF0175 family protein [Candidatus Nanoarchaeia archaeon]